MFNEDVLDMFEILLTNPEQCDIAKPTFLESLKKIDFVFKTTFISLGDVFEEDKEMQKVRNFFNDFFHANEESSKVLLSNAFKVVVVLIGLPGQRMILRVYSKGQTGLVDLVPPLEFKLHRAALASDSVYKSAFVKPSLTKSSAKLKNLEGNKALGEVYGRVHIRQQNLKSLKLKFSKKIRKAQLNK
jgi:hypothetical protein